MKSRKRLAGFSAMAAGAVLAGVAWTAEPENTGMPAAPAVPDLSKLIKPQDMEAMQRAFGAPAGGVQAAANLARRRADVATIRQRVPKERNLSIEDREGRIFIDGKVTTDRTRERVTKLTTIYDNVVDLTEFQPDEDSMLAEVDLIKEKIERTLNRDYDPARAFALPQSVAIEVVNDKLVLSGELNNADDIKQAYWIAKVYNEQIVNVLKVRRQMIEITAVFAKVVEKNQGTFGSRGMQSAIFTLPSLVAAPGSGNSPADVFSSGTWTGTTASGGFNSVSYTHLRAHETHH